MTAAKLNERSRPHYVANQTAIRSCDIRRFALQEVMHDFRIGAAELCRATEELEQQYEGMKKILPTQFSRFLKGHQDIYSTTFYTIECALPPMALQIYRAKITAAEAQFKQQPGERSTTPKQFA